MDALDAPQTWLSVRDGARVAGITEKALRHRIERGTVRSELDDQGRRVVLHASLQRPGCPAPPRKTEAPQNPELGVLLERLEALASETGKLRALTEIAESTEQHLTTELFELRAQLTTSQQKLAVLQAAGSGRRWWQRHPQASPVTA